MHEHGEFNAAAAPIDEPSGVAEALGIVAVLLGSLGCGSVLFGLMMSEALFLGGAGLSMLALLLGYLGYIRSTTAKVTLLVGLLGLLAGGMTDSEFLGYVGLAVSLVALFVGLLGGRNRGPAKAGMLLGLLGTLPCLAILFYYLTRPQEPDTPRPIDEVEAASEPTRAMNSGSQPPR
jgi:hypothetical protein